MNLMRQSQIDYVKVNQAIETANNILNSYENNKEYLKKEIKTLQREIGATKAIINLMSRDKARRKALRDTFPHGESYANSIDNNDMPINPHDLLKILNDRKKSFERLLMDTEKAIKIIKSDLLDLKEVEKTPFRQTIEYFTIPSHGWELFKLNFTQNHFTNSLHPTLLNLKKTENGDI